MNGRLLRLFENKHIVCNPIVFLSTRGKNRQVLTSIFAFVKAEKSFDIDPEAMTFDIDKYAPPPRSTTCIVEMEKTTSMQSLIWNAMKTVHAWLESILESDPIQLRGETSHLEVLHLHQLCGQRCSEEGIHAGKTKQIEMPKWATKKARCPTARAWF